MAITYGLSKQTHLESYPGTPELDICLFFFKARNMIPGEAVTLAQVRASLLVNCRVQVQAIPSSVIAFSLSLPPKKKTSSSGTVIYVVSIYIYTQLYTLI